MTLLIQINCLNEAETLPKVLETLPKKIDGIDKIEVLIVDDGSIDNTSEIAKKYGVNHIIRHNQNRGLPSAVNTGMCYAVSINADILVNTDADGQYSSADIQKLVQPILEKKADFVYGERQLADVEHMNSTKKFLQKMGAQVISSIIKIPIKDGASGFRALNKEAMQKLFLLADFASPLETLIQAKMKNLGIKIIPVVSNKTDRPSRLIKSNLNYVLKSALIIMDNLVIYKPMKIFFLTGLLLTLGGFLFAGYRFYLVEQNPERPHLTLLLLSISAIIIGSQSIFFGLMARTNRANRLLNEEILFRQNQTLSKN